MANRNAPDDLLRCPITMDLFRDPMLAPDGQTYERAAIEQWIHTHKTSPITRQPLSVEQLYPNRIVKELIGVFDKLLQQKNYQFVLDVDVRKKNGRPLFATNGKTIYGADWLQNNNNRPEIVIIRIDGAQATKQASFYVDLSRHSHIVRTFGFVHDRNKSDQNNSVLLLQEYAPEGSLFELLQERTTAPDEKILVTIFLQIIEAMIYLASNDIVHGDLACRNVLVFRFDESQPERNVMKITDFGLSRHSQLYSRTPGAARTTLNIVPVRYAAPEVLSSNATSEIYTEKSDVYSMGVLMWEAYSQGSLPWANIEHDDAVIQQVRNGDLLPQPSNCSQPFWSVIKKTWSTSPNDRPTFTELKHLLSAQYYRSSDWMLQNPIGQYPTTIRYDLSGSRTNEARRLQEEQDREIARRQQEECDRQVAHEYALLEKRKQAERPRSVTQPQRQQAPVFRSQNKLTCGGHPCSACGKCRDWYGNFHLPTRRNNATCRPRVPVMAAVAIFATGLDASAIAGDHMCRCADNK